MVLKCFVDGVILCYWQGDGVEMFCCWSNPVLLAEWCPDDGQMSDNHLWDAGEAAIADLDPHTAHAGGNPGNRLWPSHSGDEPWPLCYSDDKQTLTSLRQQTLTLTPHVGRNPGNRLWPLHSGDWPWPLCGSGDRLTRITQVADLDTRTQATDLEPHTEITDLDPDTYLTDLYPYILRTDLDPHMRPWPLTSLSGNRPWPFRHSLMETHETLHNTALDPP